MFLIEGDGAPSTIDGPTRKQVDALIRQWIFYHVQRPNAYRSEIRQCRISGRPRGCAGCPTAQGPKICKAQKKN
ncbi:unnamed protein product [Cuscuta epithymum]|uniref:Uncharacterized protein n=1 Tax=Cuscuta epithymum TaxID=186058 RepID=A0AAV0FMC0_9ASTE|nr:unnamed protein product [Cuscuta epithymum]